MVIVIIPEKQDRQHKNLIFRNHYQVHAAGIFFHKRKYGVLRRHTLHFRFVPLVSMKVFRKGDRVSFLSEKGGGIITGFKGKKTALVDTGDGLEIPMLLEELVVIKEDAVTEKEDRMILREPLLREKLSADLGKKKGSKPAAKKAPGEWEIDLHIEELTDHFSTLTNGEIVQLQLNACRAFLERAMRHHIKKVIIIHGVGAGTLRQEVHKLLSGYSNIEFYDAKMSRYGRGATEAVIYG